MPEVLVPRALSSSANALVQGPNFIKLFCRRRKLGRSGLSSALESEMVRLTVVLVASSRRANNLVEAFRTLMLRTRLEQGCIDCSVWADPDSTVHYFEEWETESDIRRRVRSDLFTSLLAVVEGAQKPPQVRFDFLTTTRGLDYVAEIRQLRE